MRGPGTRRPPHRRPAHKWLFQPYESGCVLLRRPTLRKEAFALERHYLDTGYLHPPRTDGQEVNLSDYGPQQSRRMRALAVWMSFKTFGAEAFRRTVDHGLDLAAHAATAHPELDTAPVLSIRTFRYQTATTLGPAALDALQEDVSRAATGRALVLTTRVDGRAVLHLCVVNPATTPADIEATLDLVVRAGRDLLPLSGS